MWKFLFILMVGVVSSCHVGRFFIYNFADHSDYKKFPERAIKKEGESFTFDREIRAEPLVYPQSKFESFGHYLNENKTLSYAVIKNDTLVYEWYAKKYDETSTVTTFSLAKSLVSLLIGCAVDEGKIQSIDDPIRKYLPEMKADGTDKISIRHVLNMSSGFASNESYYNPFGEVAKFYYGRQLEKYVYDLEMDLEPGAMMRYKSSDTQILGLIIEAATGKKLADYMEEKFWSKMGMEYDASWSLDKKNGTEKAFCCLNAKTLDIAKFGKLLIQKGKWNGEQLISEEWLSNIYNPKRMFKGYSMQWWLYEDKDEAFVAQGILGQYLYINPNKKTIIVRFGKDWADIPWWSHFPKVAAYYN